MNLKKTTIMNIKKMDRVFVPDIENGKYWMECPDEISGEWLKPFKDVYILTEDELLKLIAEYDRKLPLEKWAVNDSIDNAKQFLESITKQQ